MTVPASLGDGQLLISMGGPMGVADAERPEFRYLADELALLRSLVARDAPVLGICLGSQMLAAAAGARVYPNTRPGPDGAPVRLTLETQGTNAPAIRFYQRAGFQFCGVHTALYDPATVAPEEAAVFFTHPLDASGG